MKTSNFKRLYTICELLITNERYKLRSRRAVQPNRNTGVLPIPSKCRIVTWPLSSPLTGKSLWLNKLYSYSITVVKEYGESWIARLLARMWAEWPTNKWAQLKTYLFGASGAGLMAAMIGWMNAKTISKIFNTLYFTNLYKRFQW